MFFCEECRKKAATELVRRGIDGEPLRRVTKNGRETQLALACEMVGRIGIPSPDLLKRLAALLDEAQNPRPEGHADGSIHEKKFNRLRAMVRAGQTFLAAYTTALED